MNGEQRTQGQGTGSVPARGRTWLVAGAILVYCAVQSRALLNAWAHSPFDYLGWIAFLIWLIAPAAKLWQARALAIHPGLLGAGLALSFLGTAGSLNTLCYWGLAIAVAGLNQWRWYDFVWLVTAITWMPLFGYFASGLGPDTVAGLRIVIAALGTSVALAFHRLDQKKPSAAEIEFHHMANVHEQR